ncbi:SIR2 family NAD-dependent protein deacylase [Methanolobus bombayensis]|uniref:SIR2 family NAD-dependent protein deacylase n=1 Tax=Methanolobus bombayensis TaxID=38023 RepID=UPI001AE6FEC9|nr:NAD-dependent protein deacylase [Methanolobus bombayensis]MBP1908368.1 NAD-dependent deacetylase [Methanolobus bombayensis]
MQRFLDLLEKSENCVFLSGAGISTFSGIPDFRGSNGLYAKYDANKIFDLAYFHKDPAYFYTHAREFIYDLDTKEPNLIHRTLAMMEKKSFINSLITQNIDLLHQKAGSSNVIEIHGSPANHRCLSCGENYSYADVRELLEKETVPYCTRCNGLIKPDITFFGEMLDESAITNAMGASSKADLFVVIGSSLVVHPAASLPLYSLKRGGKLVIVNNMPTPLDGYAYLKYDELGDFFNHLSSYLNDK